MTPRSSQNKVEISEAGIKVWVTASPTDGQANEAVCKVVASALDMGSSHVTIRKGHSSREKILAIEGMDLEQVHACLARGKRGNQKPPPA